MPNPSLEIFQRFLNEHLGTLKKSLDDLVGRFADNDQSRKVKAVENLRESVHALKLAPRCRRLSGLAYYA